MGAVPALPRIAAADTEADILCPWCGADACDAEVRLEDLFGAAQGGQLAWVTLEREGEPDGRALTSACPSCARPFAVAVDPDRFHIMRLLPMRTPADLKLIAGGA